MKNNSKPTYKKWWFILLVSAIIVSAIWISIDDMKKSNREKTVIKNEQAPPESDATKGKIYDSAEIKDELSGNGEKIGKVSIIKASSADITDEMLSDWYFNYVEKTKYNYYIIEYTDYNFKKGVFANNAMVIKDCNLTTSPTNDNIPMLGDGGYYYNKQGGKLAKGEAH